MKKKKLNIQKAIQRPGDLTRKAKAAGESLLTFAKKHAKDGNTTTGRQARFYLYTLRPINKRNKD